MKRMLLGAAAGVALFLLAAEALLRLLPVSSATLAGRYIDPQIQTYARHHPWRYATGWDLRHPQRLVTNGHGFVSAHEFVRDERAVALVGDSYVESASLDAADRPGAQLERALAATARPVYAMGVAGTALLDYAERIRFAQQQFGVRDVVVLVERGDLRQSLCGSGNVHSQCLDPQTLAPVTVAATEASLAKRLLRDSALLQYLVSQLKLSPGRLLTLGFSSGVPVEAPPVPPAAPTAAPPPVPGEHELRVVDAVAAAFFERIRPHVSGRLVIVMDSDRQALQQGRPTADPLRSRFIDRAREAGAVVVDTEPLFRAHFAASRLSLDLGPQDGHFNPLGVQLIASAAARALNP